MSVKVLRTAGFLVLALGVSLVGTTESASAPLAALLQAGINRGYPGIAMITAGADGSTEAAAAGYSNLERHTALRIDDGFHTASINKTFTAVSIMMLVDQGRLSLTATLREVLGDAVARIPNAERITVAEVLDHSSGIYATNNDAAYLATIIGAQADPCLIWKPENLVGLADKDRQQPSGAPGSGHYYSDTNYVLLGMIVEKVSGISYKTYVASHIFAPLGMRYTYFYSDYVCRRDPPPDRTVEGYMLATKEIREAVKISPLFRPVPGEKRAGGDLLNTTLAAERIDAAGGIITTLPDLVLFAAALFREKLLSASSQKVMAAALEGAESLPIGKHRTWTLQAMRKSYGVVLYKEGDGPGGVNTLMAHVPAKDQIYVGFTNIFGNFNEVAFMLDEVIGPLVLGK